MKSTVIFILLLILTGCFAKYHYQLNTECKDLPKAEILNSLVTKLSSEGFTIKENNFGLDMIKAEIKTNKIKNDNVFMWSFYYLNGTIIASAHSYNEFTQSSFDNITSYNDNTDKSIELYWNIRNELERICGQKIIIEKYIEEDIVEHD